ncbi:TIGR03086 family metal-binding protein [Kribbella sp. ALI-6-A]|uniref:TIGR03086 family metal-binding protein n=1 Tax=Kribbella sp. ALI-6-A TaxID=1933817 RepID=UPI000A0051B1|nr:TIGR03086 family metal-binding protein [Kribbella sp. ALI-6-A]
MDVVEMHRRAGAEFVRQVEAVGPDQWSAPTPCADWDVRALVNHVVGEERWAVPLLAGRTIADVGDALDGDLLGDDPAAAAAQAAMDAQAATADPVPTVHLSYGDEDTTEYLRQLVADQLIHGWDLAVAIGSTPRMDPEVVDEVARWFEQREAAYRDGGAIGARVPSGPDPVPRLLGAFGRDVSWTPGGAEPS